MKLKNYLSLLFGLFSYAAFAQPSGTIGNTGLKYNKDGISFKKISATLEGKTLENGFIPMGKTASIIISDPTGFVNTGGKIFPAVELTYFSPEKTIIYKQPNVYKQYAASGVDGSALAEIEVPIAVTPITMKNYKTADVMVKISDLKSKTTLTLILALTTIPASEAQPAKPVQTQATQEPKANTAANNNASSNNNSSSNKTVTATLLKESVEKPASLKGLTIGKITTGIDTAIKVDKSIAYLSIELENISGITMPEVMAGTLSYAVFDQAGKQIPVTAKLLKRINSSMGTNEVNILVKVPYKKKTELNQIRTVKFNFENPGKTKTFQIVSTK